MSGDNAGTTALDPKPRIHDFIRREILFEDASAELTDQTPLLEGLLDSMGLMELVAFLEEEFDLEIQDDAIVRDNFATIDAISRAVAGWTAGR